MESELACIDGQLFDAAAAVIPVTDQGLLRGDGAFEVVRLYDGVPYALDQHLARLERSAAGLRLPLDAHDFATDVATLLGARDPGPDDVLVRMLATRGGRRIVLIEPMPVLPATVALAPVTYAPSRTRKNDEVGHSSTRRCGVISSASSPPCSRASSKAWATCSMRSNAGASTPASRA